MELSTRPAETEALGRGLAGRLAPGAVVLLEGPLGAGKTTFVRGLVEGCGGDPEEVASPTYLGCLEYQTPAGMVLHLDLYREPDTSRLAACLAEAAERAPLLVVVEWAGAAVPGAWTVRLADGPGLNDRTLETTAP